MHVACFSRAKLTDTKHQFQWEWQQPSTAVRLAPDNILSCTIIFKSANTSSIHELIDFSRESCRRGAPQNRTVQIKHQFERHRQCRDFSLPPWRTRSSRKAAPTPTSVPRQTSVATINGATCPPTNLRNYQKRMKGVDCCPIASPWRPTSSESNHGRHVLRKVVISRRFSCVTEHDIIVLEVDLTDIRTLTTEEEGAGRGGGV